MSSISSGRITDAIATKGFLRQRNNPSIVNEIGAQAVRLINVLVEAITPFVGPDARGQHDLALNDPNPYSLALIAA
jgi:hypothetical protein